MAETQEQPMEMGDVADVTNSTAFLSIDSLLEEGKLEEVRAAHLKGKFKELHDRVLQIYNHDNFLLRRARQLRKDLDGEKVKVEKCAEVAKTDDSTITKQKKELAAVEHELSVAQEKESMLQVEALELDRKKQNLTHEVEDAVAAEEARLKPQIESLHREIRVIGEEIEKTQKTFDALKDDREKLFQQEQQIRDQMEKTSNTMYDAKIEFTRIEREPERAKKQADIVFKANQTANKELNTIIDKLASQSLQLKELDEKKRQMEEQQCDLWATLQTNRTAIDQREKLMDSISASLDAERETSNHLTQHVVELEQMMRSSGHTINAERDRLNKALRDKDQGMKQFKRVEQAKADTLNEKEMFLKQKDILFRETAHIKKQRRDYANQLDELKRDVDILINNFLKEEISEKRAISDKEAVHKQIQSMEEEVAFRSEEEQQLTRELTDLGIKREQMSRESSRNQTRVSIAKDELKVKEVIVRELHKRNQELLSRLAQLTELYTQVKRERSNKAALIQAAQQTMSETQEKIKILENELEVLRRESLIKDHELSKKKRETHDERTHCENLRVEKNKTRQNLDTADSKVKDLQQQMAKLNTVITSTEEEMLLLKKKYEDAVENRNYTGIQLIDRNDELCILYEKSNIQETILKQGMVMLNQREEEIRATAVELADLQREIDLCQKVLPQVRDLEEDCADLLESLEDERWRAEILEEDLMDPANHARWRKLGSVHKGTGPSVVSAAGSLPPQRGEDTAAPAVSADGDPQHGTNDIEDMGELRKKMQDVEQKVASVNERLMEKDLILEELTEHSNKLRKQAMSGRDYTLQLAKKVIGYRFSIKCKTKRMMATLSELSMVQASSIKLESDRHQLEEEVSEAQQRLERGLPPTEDIAQEVLREKEEKRRRDELMRTRKERLKAEREQLAKMTTAEERPNSYIPDAELLIPKPYGSHAPFKPNLDAQRQITRFYRKTETREIDFDA